MSDKTDYYVYFTFGKGGVYPAGDGWKVIRSHERKINQLLVDFLYEAIEETGEYESFTIKNIIRLED